MNSQASFLLLNPASCALAALVLSGCAGIGGTSKYGCKAPTGVHCQSVSGVYHNSLQNTLPSQRKSSVAPENKGIQPNASPVAPARPDAAPSRMPAPVSGVAPGTPLRSESRVLRLWIAPWDDADGDLMDQTYAYVLIEEGRWLLDHAKRRIREADVPVHPPAARHDKPDSETNVAPIAGSSTVPSAARPTSLTQPVREGINHAR
jgi:conjugal transfer pilus assembly protein TraV